MEYLHLGRIAALVPEFAVKDLPLGRTHDDDGASRILGKCTLDCKYGLEKCLTLTKDVIFILLDSFN